MYYGCKKEIDDNRDFKSFVCYAKQTNFPDSYIIDMPEIKDQGIVNSCVAHSLATFLEENYLEDNIKFSTGFIYGYRPFGYSQEEGMYPREAIKTLLKIGDVPKENFDHNKEMPEIKSLLDENFNNLKDIADVYKIKSYARLYTTAEIKEYIYNDIPVPISIPVYNDLAYDKETFIIQRPCGSLDGYHMMIIYGYNESGWLVQNSWGKDWANEGRAVLSYSYPIDTAWAIDTDSNKVVTYQTIWQKIYSFVIKLINRFKNLLS